MEKEMEEDKMGKGWECPKCEQVYAPSVKKCEICVSKPVVESTDKKKELLKD
jgi:hypothetical protein